MTLLNILNRELEGKRVTGGDVPRNMIGATIVNVQLHRYEPIFEIGIRQPNGTIEVVEILDDWNIEVE